MAHRLTDGAIPFNIYFLRAFKENVPPPGYNINEYSPGMWLWQAGPDLVVDRCGGGYLTRRQVCISAWDDFAQQEIDDVENPEGTCP